MCFSECNSFLLNKHFKMYFTKLRLFIEVWLTWWRKVHSSLVINRTKFVAHCYILRHHFTQIWKRQGHGFRKIHKFGLTKSKKTNHKIFDKCIAYLDTISGHGESGTVHWSIGSKIQDREYSYLFVWFFKIISPLKLFFLFYLWHKTTA